MVDSEKTIEIINDLDLLQARVVLAPGGLFPISFVAII